MVQVHVQVQDQDQVQALEVVVRPNQGVLRQKLVSFCRKTPWRCISDLDLDLGLVLDVDLGEGGIRHRTVQLYVVFA